MECKKHGARGGWPFSVSASTRHSKGLSKGVGGEEGARVEGKERFGEDAFGGGFA